jgi:YbbR domain-containing protein
MVGVWFGFTRSHDTIIALNIPMEYVNRPSGFEILDTSADEIRVQLYGSSALIRSLRHSQVQARIDLGKGIEGKNSFHITQDNITLPPGVFLNRVEPSTIDVILDVPITREIPVQADWVGKLPEHLIMTDVTISPSTVRVVGGSKVLEKVNTIYTVPVRLDNIARSGSITAQLLITPPSLKPVPGSTDKVTVHFTLEERN